MRPFTTGQYRIPTLFSSKSLSSLNQNENNGNPPLNKSEYETLQNVLNDYTTHSEAPRTAPVYENLTMLQRPSTSTNLVRPSSTRLINKLIPKHAPSACGHYNAGQELCYLCHQRNRRNVPVYLHEETRQKELEENQLLMQYQSLRDLDKQLKDEEKRNIQRMDRAKIDAFNLGVTEAMRAKKAERPKTSDMSVS